MAINPKKLSLYAITGILAAVIVIAAVMTAGVQLPTTKASTGTLHVYIKDAPVELQYLYVTIDSLEVQNPDGTGWTTLTLTGNHEHFDLLALQDKTMGLAVQDLAVGSYNKIRLHVKDATAVFSDDPTEVDLKVPSEKIDILIKFEIKAEQPTSIIIDMTADSVAISNSNNLKPVIKATVIPPTENSPAIQGATTETTEPPTTTPPPTTDTPTETPVETPTTAPTLPSETPPATGTIQT
jgi:hypothetical protein